MANNSCKKVFPYDLKLSHRHMNGGMDE